MSDLFGNHIQFVGFPTRWLNALCFGSCGFIEEDSLCISHCTMEDNDGPGLYGQQGLGW